MDQYNHSKGEGKRGFREGNPGRPKGSRNKLSLQAVDKMVELGFDPIEQYMEVLNKARQTGNLAVEERALSRLMQFRYAGLHHSMVTNTDDTDLEVSVTRFELPEMMGKVDEANDESTNFDDNSVADDAAGPTGINVTRFEAHKSAK